MQEQFTQFGQQRQTVDANIFVFSVNHHVLEELIHRLAQREKKRAEEERKRSKDDQRGNRDGSKRDRTNRTDRVGRSDQEDKR